MEIALRDSNQAAFEAVADCAANSPTDPAWEVLAGIHKKLLEDHAAAIRSLQVPQSSCCSLQAVGCFQVGLLPQVLSISCWLTCDRTDHRRGIQALSFTGQSLSKNVLFGYSVHVACSMQYSILTCPAKHCMQGCLQHQKHLLATMSCVHGHCLKTKKAP